MHPATVRVLGELGVIPRWMTPFFRISENVPRKRFFAEFLEPFRAAGVPIAAQLMGNCPERLAVAATVFAELGVAEINLNFGCPSSTVLRSGAGGALLKTPERMRAILEAVRRAVAPLPVTVKMRVGMDAPGEMELLLPNLPCDRLYLHFRTVRELYRPAPGRIARLRRAVELAGSVPVVANGDIDTPEDAAAVLASTGAAGVMCARGLFRDPGLLRRIAGLPAEDAETLRRKLYRRVTAGIVRNGQSIQLCRLLWNRTTPPEPVIPPGRS